MIEISNQKKCKCYKCGQEIILLQRGMLTVRLDPKEVRVWMKKNGDMFVGEAMKYGKWRKWSGYAEHVCSGQQRLDGKRTKDGTVQIG